VLRPFVFLGLGGVWLADTISEKPSAAKIILENLQLLVFYMNGGKCVTANYVGGGIL
jgi:hypothetical protein